MNKAQQDLTWQCLPKDVRDTIRERYRKWDRVTFETECLLCENLFGYHNLISDKNPSELLFVEQEKVVEKYNEVTKDYAETGDKWCSGYIDALNDFFANKCLPDKEPMRKIDAADSLIAMAKDEMDINDKEPSVKGEPKFKVGEKVVVKNAPHILRTVTSIEENGLYVLDHVIYDIKESDLEPYTESEVKSMQLSNVKDKIDEYFDTHSEEEVLENLERYGAIKTNNNMDEKELNLCEILASGDLLESEFFSPAFGKVTLSEVLLSEREVVIMDVAGGCEYSLNPYGCLMSSPHGFCVLFPSRALYEKYPLDARKAWDEWRSERTPKTWNDLYKIGKISMPASLLELEGESGIEGCITALYKIHQLIEVGYGGNVTKEEWVNNEWKYTIECHGDGFCINSINKSRNNIAFHTREQTEEFLSYEENISLLKDYFMI